MTNTADDAANWRELRAVLDNLRPRRAFILLMTEARDDLDNPLRDVFALLLAELCEVDARERATLKDLDGTTPWLTRPSDEE